MATETLVHAGDAVFRAAFDRVGIKLHLVPDEEALKQVFHQERPANPTDERPWEYSVSAHWLDPSSLSFVPLEEIAKQAVQLLKDRQADGEAWVTSLHPYDRKPNLHGFSVLPKKPENLSDDAVLMASCVAFWARPI
jgi:hypothetical protein